MAQSTPVVPWARDKVVLITGGTSGFGFALAEVCAASGARVAIVGRDISRLEAAVSRLRATGAEILGISADLSRDTDAERMVSEVVARFQRLDLLVNNVGKSARGLATETSPEQFTELWQANFLTAVRATQGALPELRRSRGHVVFVGSLASKAAARYLGAYPASKFAVAAYAHQMRLELAGDGVHVLLVCPGPIARSDAGQRYDEQAGNLPESARRPGGGVKLRGIPPHELAQGLLLACERRSPELVRPRYARWLFAIAQLWPRLADAIILRRTSA